ncbi:type I-E CRISPR-associated protein Cse2/CasB [Phytoactinopolyspora limicola]|uniref:type I-E CRISPR-associated protein Cse2/CasB n=1 Tax=Phytoactinopolyspora limicola TaxID=2715536 RepID=UPI001407F87C|nr:type I-E CRISPR-associated protein Cse2/CasB [Phytoactinopolyspora limicola]
MTTETTPKPEQRKRRLDPLGFALERKIKKLQDDYLANNSAARADLARLRRGLGKPAGSVPEIWERTVGAVPASLSWDRDDPSPAEQAAHITLTLYAVHQQSRPGPMHVADVSFGQAVRRLARRTDASEDAVSRRFMAVATAQTVDEILVHVRGLVTQLKANHISLDYAQFADDVFGLLTPGRATSVRLRWGREFYRVDSSSDDVAADDVAADNHPSTDTSDE